MFVAALFSTYENPKPPKVSFNRSVDKQIMGHSHTVRLFYNEKKWVIKTQKDIEEH